MPNVDATDITFGNGGKFKLDINDLAFFSLNQTQTLKATITLLAAPQSTTPGHVPEPATLALMGIGLAGLSVRAKRRKA